MNTGEGVVKVPTLVLISRTDSVAGCCSYCTKTMMETLGILTGALLICITEKNSRISPQNKLAVSVKQNIYSSISSLTNPCNLVRL